LEGNIEGGSARSRPHPSRYEARQLALPGLSALGPPPRLSPGLELIGEYHGSGVDQPMFLARRADGQVVQMTQLVYTIATAIDGRKDYESVAREVGSRIGRDLDGEDVAYLVERKLTPAGITASADGAVLLPRQDPLLALRYKFGVLPERLVGAISKVFLPLFYPPIAIAILLTIGAADAWLFFAHGIAQGVRQILRQPEVGLLVIGLVIVSTALHEFGHATACRYGGARPGRIGVGLYLAWPVFYSDVTDSYRLRRSGRLRTDLGGVYFNLVFALALMLAYAFVPYEPLLVVVALVQLEALHQFFPFFRLDGYYVISDLIGVPDLFARIGPTLRSLFSPRARDPRVAGLRPFARAVVVAWVLLTLASMCFLYLLLIAGLPRLLATAQQSFLIHAATLEQSVASGNLATGTLAAIEEVLLLLPLVAIALSVGGVGKTVVATGWRYSNRRPVARAVVLVGSALLIGFGAGFGLAHHLYKPIQPWERGTVAATTGGGAALAPDLPAVQHEIAPLTPTLHGPPAPSPSATTPSPSGSAPAVFTAPSSPSAGGASPSPQASPAPSPAPSPVPSPSPAASPVPSPSASP
jgi:putative peptide zinc metalloprotease protein